MLRAWEIPIDTEKLRRGGKKKEDNNYRITSLTKLTSLI
jgi:hypothetical protein